MDLDFHYREPRQNCVNPEHPRASSRKVAQILDIQAGVFLPMWIQRLTRGGLNG